MIPNYCFYVIKGGFKIFLFGSKSRIASEIKLPLTQNNNMSLFVLTIVYLSILIL